MIDLLSVQSLTDAIEGVFSEVEAVIQQFNPAPIVKAVDDAYQRILGMLEKLNPADFIKEIDQLYADDIVGVVQAISPEQLLLPPLTELFARINGLLVALDIEVLFKPILDKLRALDQELGDGLHRTEGAYQAMLAALDAAAGGGSASVSVSVSAGGG
jgi:hypothetical protein